MDLIIKEDDISIVIYFFKIFFISIFTYYLAIKIINNKKINFKTYIYILVISIICGLLKYLSNSIISIFGLNLLLAFIFAQYTKNNIGYSLIIMSLSLSINNILFFISGTMCFFPLVLMNIQNDITTFVFMMIVYIILIYSFFNIKKFRNGFPFLQSNLNNEKFDILILNVSMVVLLTTIILSNYETIMSRSMVFAFIIFSIIMFITIQKSLQLYYKQKLLEQELNETKDELEKKKEEVKQLEAENLNFSKTSHTLAHKQKSLEYKLEQLKQKYEIAEEIEIEDRIKDISKEIYNKTPEVEISKTGILEIDDMLKYMQSECIKNNIEFSLQIKGNIYEMINNYISKEDLSILIADHVKNAIIAINYSENINKSILVRLGKINKIYSLYIYDSGIEFEKETLSNLGKIPSTTHADNGGTGMGFMNTFDTLRKYNASLIINEYNKPSNDNYTKSIVIKLDRRNEFTINSYKDKINN